jgi:hypothetical protein
MCTRSFTVVHNINTTSSYPSLIQHATNQHSILYSCRSSQIGINASQLHTSPSCLSQLHVSRIVSTACLATVSTTLRSCSLGLLNRHRLLHVDVVRRLFVSRSRFLVEVLDSLDFVMLRFALLDFLRSAWRNQLSLRVVRYERARRLVDRRWIVRFVTIARAGF